MRVLGAEDEAHGHHHSHSQPHVSPEVIKNSSIKGSETENGPRSRNKTTTNSTSPEIPKIANHAANGPSKLSAYLNLFGDFVHNMSVFKTLLLSSDDLTIPSKQYRWIGVSADVIITHSLCNNSLLIQDGRILLRLSSYRCNHNFGLFRS